VRDFGRPAVEFWYTETMARPKGPEETTPVHTRLTASQHAGFREYIRRQQEQIKHTGVQLTEAAVLRGMVLRCLELEQIPHSSAQQSLGFVSTSAAPSSTPTTSSAAPAAPDAPAGDTAARGATAPAAPDEEHARPAAPARAAKPKGAKKEPTAAAPGGKVAAKGAKGGAKKGGR